MIPVIDADNLEFSWPSSSAYKLFIDHLSVVKGEKVFIQGPSGCGKSTFLSLLAGVNLANKGSLNVLGTQVNTLSSSQRDKFRAEHIGYIFQQFNLLPYLNSIENVAIACAFSSIRKKRVLKTSVSVADEAKRLLSHLDISDEALLNMPVNQLSVGQQQRVAVARALIGSPEIIIADEPTSSLDADSCDAFMQLLIQEATTCNATLLFVSHDQRLKSFFDRSLTLTVDREQNSAYLTLPTEQRKGKSCR